MIPRLVYRWLQKICGEWQAPTLGGGYIIIVIVNQFRVFVQVLKITNSSNNEECKCNFKSESVIPQASFTPRQLIPKIPLHPGNSL